MTLETITRCNVRDALRQLSCDRSSGDTPLAELETIRRSLEVAGFRSTEGTRHFELARVLGELAEAELLRLRSIVVGREHAVLADTSNPIETMERLVEDYSYDHADLEGASAVYHLYVRTDLGLGLPDLVAVLGDRHRRTLQRRLQRGVRMITMRLGELERSARIQARDDRLARRIPDVPTPLIGRHALLSRMSERVDGTSDGPSITALRGEAGVGKSALAASFARRALDRGWVDDIAWVDVSRTKDGSPDAAAILRLAVAQLDAGGEVGIRLGVQDNAIFEEGEGDGYVAVPRAKCFGDRRVLVVIDGLDDPAIALAVARGLAGSDGPRFALLAGRVGWADTPVPRVIDVPPLARADAISLLRNELERRGMAVASSSDDATLAPIVGAASGNPGAIRHAAAMLRASSISDVARDLEEGSGEAIAYIGPLWHCAWTDAPSDTRAVVRAAIGGDDASIADYHRARFGERFGAALRDAVDRGMLVREGGERPRFRTACFLGRYVRATEHSARRDSGSAISGSRIEIATSDYNDVRLERATTTPNRKTATIG